MKSKENFKATMKTKNPTNLCLKQKSFSTYSIKHEDILIQYGNMENTSAGVTYALSFSEKIRTTNDEMLMVSNIDLLSSLGGALGLFIGFSFFGYLATALDSIIEKGFMGIFKRYFFFYILIASKSIPITSFVLSF